MALTSAHLERSDQRVSLAEGALLLMMLPSSYVNQYAYSIAQTDIQLRVSLQLHGLDRMWQMSILTTTHVSILVSNQKPQQRQRAVPKRQTLVALCSSREGSALHE